MFQEDNYVTDVRNPGGEEAEAAELGFTETTPQEVVTQPVNRLIHLLANKY